MIKINFQTGEALVFEKDTLRDSVLAGFDFHRAILDDYELDKADFRTSKLRGTSLRNIKASFADFSHTPLMTSDFTGAKLVGSRFIDAKAMYADFTDAILTKSDMTNADVTGAIFRGAHLEGAVMLCQGLNKAELDGAFYDSETGWPLGFDPVLSGAILTNTQ
jgi:uncharacterized protein YjbI with pentapeptide repeats